MSPEALLAQFDVMAEAPNGVQKLRELILQLAVRGKLVPQDASDEPARVLLERIAAEKMRLFAEGSISRPKPAEVLPQDDRPHGLPDSWCWVRLSSVGGIVGGGTPKTDIARYWANSGGVPWLTPADLNGLQGKYVQQGRRQISQSGLENSSAQLLPAGAVLFSSRAPIGYVAIATDPLATNQGFKSCVPYLDEMSEFIYRFLQAVGPEVDRTAPGTTFREVSGKLVAQIPFPLPPLAEQQRIVAKVDELMSLCDRLEARQKRRTEARVRLNRSALHHLTAARDDDELATHWERLRENFDLLYDTPETVAELRQAVLQLAVRGKLVPQDPSEEPASVLLERIAAERGLLFQAGKLGKAKSLRPLEAGDVPFDIPEPWEWVRLGRILIAGPQNGYSPKPTDRTTDTRAVTLSATTSGVFNARYFKYVDESIRTDSNCWLHTDDLLFQRGNSIEYVGIAAVYDGPDGAFIYPDLMIRVRCSKAVDLRFVHLAANSVAGRAHFTARASGTSGSMPKINQTDVLELPIPLAPLAEQRRIATRINELMSLCDALESRLTHERENSVRLTASVVHNLSAM